MTKKNPTPPGMDASPKNSNKTISLESNITTANPLTTVCPNHSKPSDYKQLTTLAFDSMYGERGNNN